MNHEPRSTRTVNFSLDRLMLAMGWLAIAFAVLRYCLDATWVRYAVVAFLGSAAFGAFIGLVVHRAARRQEESPERSSLATTGLLLATLAAIAVVWSSRH